MNPFLNKKNAKKENQLQPIKNNVINYTNNSKNNKYYLSSFHTYNKLNHNEDVNNNYKKNNIFSERQSFESLNDQNNTNENINYFENKMPDYNDSQYNNEYFNNFKYYEPSLTNYNSLPLPKYNKQNDNNKNFVTHNEYTKYNPNYFNQRKKINIKKEDKNKLTINNISHNNFIPKKTVNPINNSKYGELSKKKIFNANNFTSKYYDSFNNTFLNYLTQNNYNEDSLKKEGQNEENNNNNNYQMNKLTRYDLRKKKSLADGQTFFIKKAKNSKNYQFFESKKLKNNKSNIIKKNINKSEIKIEIEPEENKSESIYLDKYEDDEMVNNHNFIIIKSPSLERKKNNENEDIVKVDNYKYKETKVKGPDNYKPVMKLRIGLNGEKFYEKFVPEKKVIKYTYEPECKIISSENMNNVGFKKIVSNYHTGIRKKYKKINPEYLITPAASVIITNDNYNYNGNVIEKINDYNNNDINNNDNIIKEQDEEKIIK